RLEARTALSGGLQAGLAAMDSYRAEVAPAVFGGVDAAWTAQEVGDALPATYPSADAALAAGGTHPSSLIPHPSSLPSADTAPSAGGAGTWEAPEIPRSPQTYTNLVPLVSELITGLAGSIALLGQAYRDGVPSSVLIDDAASAIGSTPARI